MNINIDSARSAINNYEDNTSSWIDRTTDAIKNGDEQALIDAGIDPKVASSSIKELGPGKIKDMEEEINIVENKLRDTLAESDTLTANITDGVKAGTLSLLPDAAQIPKKEELFGGLASATAGVSDALSGLTDKFKGTFMDIPMPEFSAIKNSISGPGGIGDIVGNAKDQFTTINTSEWKFTDNLKMDIGGSWGADAGDLPFDTGSIGI
tara:strand:+ start:230 stop:856 length:627 start_codon:yes stop_codon:yes gene_type:complete